jgi:hypothetical protein
MAKKTKKNAAGQTPAQTMRWIFAYQKYGSNYNDLEKRPYKKSIDEDRKAAPVGYRWSQYAVEKGYAKSTSVKPSAADIKKYSGEKKNGRLLIYRETRINKSDATRKGGI